MSPFNHPEHWRLNRRAVLMGGAAAAALSACAKSAAPATPAGGAGDGVVATTQHGKIRGLMEEGVIEFRGVRYAQPPTGPLRFQAPKSLEPWTGEQPANQYGQAAM